MQKVGMIACALILVWAAWAMLHDLGQGPLQIYDEGTYAQVVAESMAHGNFLDFTLWGLPWLEKPPLYFWLAGAATYITQSDVLGIRLPAALFGIATIALTMLLAYRASANYWVAAVSGALLVATEPYVAGAREARFDMLIAFFTLLAFYSAWQAVRFRKSNTYLVFGVAVGLAVLTKSVVAVFAAIALPLVSLWPWDLDAKVGAGFLWIKDRRFWIGAGLGISILAPWHIYEWWLYSGEFWRQYIGYHVVERFEQNIFGSPDLQTAYVPRLAEQAPVLLGAFLLALAALPLYWPSLTKHERAFVGSCIGLLGVMVLVFFTAQTRALSYLIPLYPFAVLFVSCSVWYLCRCIKPQTNPESVIR